jgi:ATP-dependent protease HslVU (ClpYQ) ATPase subunit
MPSSTIRSFVAGEDLNRRIASEAAKRNMTVSSYLKEVMNLYFELDQDKIEEVAKIAKFLDLEIPEVVNAMLRDKLESLLESGSFAAKEKVC